LVFCSVETRLSDLGKPYNPIAALPKANDGVLPADRPALN